MSKKNLIILLVLYVLSAALTYGGLSLVSGKKAPTQTASTQTNLDGTSSGNRTDDENPSALSQLLTINANDPRDQICPLSGQKFTNVEREAWEKRRPLAVMIENHPDARPQSGLSKADIVFEALAEGGVTRYMAMFYCNVQAEDTTLAPIRSARTYFIDWASGFNLPMYVHVGGANTPGPADALGQLGDYGWNGQNDMNQFSIGYPTFVRDYNRVEGKEIATEHTMVTTTEKLWQVAAKRNWTNLTPVRTIGKKTSGGEDWKAGYTPWIFQDGKAGSGSVSDISYEFWDGYKDFAVSWKYDPATNGYKRTMGGQPDIDMNTDKQIEAKNVVVLLTDEKGPIDDKKHMLYRTTGIGDALIFQNGQVIKGKWAKKTREAQLTFTDDKGKELEFVRGLTWISIVSLKTKVAY